MTTCVVALMTWHCGKHDMMDMHYFSRVLPWLPAGIYVQRDQATHMFLSHHTAGSREPRSARLFFQDDVLHAMDTTILEHPLTSALAEKHSTTICQSILQRSGTGDQRV